MKSKTLISIILFTFLFMSCDTSTDSKNNLNNNTEVLNAKAFNSENGKDYFRAVILGYGPLVEKVPEINDYMKLSLYITNKKDYKSVTSFHDELLEKISDADPSYFEGFKKYMESGDHLLIQRVLKEGSERYNEAFTSLKGYDDLLGYLKKDEKAVITALKNIGIDAGNMNTEERFETLAKLSKKPLSFFRNFEAIDIDSFCGTLRYITIYRIFVDRSYINSNNVIRFVQPWNDAPSTFYINLKDMKFRTLLRDRIINSVAERFQY